MLSFTNLIEAHVLRELRSEHGVSLEAVRQALEYAERTLGVQRLLLRRELCSEGGQLFLEALRRARELVGPGAARDAQVIRATPRLGASDSPSASMCASRRSPRLRLGARM